MEFKINDLSLSEREVEVTLTYDEIKTDLEKEVKKQSKNIQLAGFRKGKVPVNILKKMYGDTLEYEASEKVANKRFWELADKEHFHPIGQPSMTDIKFKPGEDFLFKVKFEVLPKLEVKEYTGLDVEIPKFEVKEEDVNSELNYLLKSNSTNEEVEVVGDDNNFILDVEVTRLNEKDEPYDGSKPEKIQIDLTNERVQKDIVDNAKGKKKDDTFEFSFTDNHKEKDEEGNEKEVSEDFRYSAKINGIKKIILPELNEEFVKKVTKDKASNEEELKAEIRKDIQTYVDQRTDDFISNKLISQVVKNNDFQPPSSMVANVLDEMLKREEESVKKQGYPKFDKTEAANRLKSSAEFEVKWYLIKDAIQKKENFTIGDDELQKLAEQDAEKTGIPVDKLVNYYKTSNYSEKLLDKKLFDYLKENNNIKKVDPEVLSKNEEKDTK